MTPLIEDRVKKLVSVRRYGDARKLLKSQPDSPVIRQYLKDIDTLETPIDRGVVTGFKYLAYAGVIVMMILIGIVVLIALGLR